MLYVDCVNNDRFFLNLLCRNESVIIYKENVEIYYYDWFFDFKINGGFFNV